MANNGSLAALTAPNPTNAPVGPTKYAVAAATAIPATRFARRVEISEDGAGSQQGLTITYNDGTVVSYTPADYPIVIGARNLEHGRGSFLARPPQLTTPADIYCTVAPFGTATSVDVLEIP